MVRLEFFQLLGGAGAAALGLDQESESITVPPQPLSGLVAISVEAHPLKHLLHVSMFVDDKLLSADPTSPFAFAWDTRVYPDGAHVLRADAVYRNRTHSESLTVQVRNAVAAPVVYPSETLFPSDLLPT